jgi:hypothetical protein
MSTKLANLDRKKNMRDRERERERERNSVQ